MLDPLLEVSALCNCCCCMAAAAAATVGLLVVVMLWMAAVPPEWLVNAMGLMVASMGSHWK